MKTRIDPALRDAIMAMFAATAGGFLASPPGLDGRVGLGVAGITGVPRPRGPWDAVVAVDAPELPGDELTFTTLEDGTVLVDADVPDGAVLPLAAHIEEQLDPPYRAAAVRHPETSVWGVAARSVELLRLHDVVGETLIASRIGRAVELTVDDELHDASEELVRALEQWDGDIAVQAELVDDGLWAATVSRL